MARAAARTEPAAAEGREAAKLRAAPAGAPPQSAGNLALQALLAGGLLRAKLQVGAPGDPAEQEADRMADAALAGKEGCTCAPGAPPCPRCAAGHAGEDAGAASTLLRKPRGASVRGAPASLPPLGPARALGAHERALFEPRYGADLSAVRIHDGPEAAAGARLLDARAFAIGNEIAFGGGEYRPETLDGRRLLGHELAHIVLGHGGLRRQAAGSMSSAQAPSTPAFTPASSPDATSSPTSVLTLGGQEENMCRIDPANEDSIVFMGRTLVATNEGVRAALVEAIDLGGLALVRHLRGTLESMLPHRFCNPMLGSCRDVPAQGPAVTERGRATIGRLLPMIDTELTAIRADHERFKTLVRNTTRLRLQGNVRALDLWRDFIVNQIGASTLQGQVAGTVVQRYSMMAFHHPDQALAYRALEQMLTTRSVANQRTQAAIVAGEIHGGCAHCHRLSYETNVLAGRNEPFTAPLSIMEQLQAGGEGPRPAFAEPAAAAPGSTPPPSIAPTPSMDPGVAASPTLSAAVGLAARINPYLQQLGPRGYKILPLDDVNALGLPAEALRDYVQHHIAERRAHFLAAIEAAGSSDFDYLMPLVVVQELMQLEDPTVQALVRAESRERAEAARSRAIGLLILGGVSLLLTIFPPTAGLGIALGAVGSAIGFADSLETYQQGVLLGHMVGATHVITPEQEVAARQMRIMGQIGMVMSALDLGATGLTAAYRVLRVMRTAGAIRAVEVEAANGTRVLIEGLDSGAPVATASGAGRPPMRIELPAAPAVSANPLAPGPGPRPGGLPALPGAVADTAPALVPQALTSAVGAGGARTVQRGGYLLTLAEDGAMVVTSAARPDLMIVIRGRTATFYEVLEGGGMRVVGSATVPARGAGAPAGLLPASAEAASAPPVTVGGGPIITPAPPVRPQLTSGAPTTYTWDEISRMRQPQLWQEREIYMRQVHGAAGSQYFPVPGTGGRFVDVPVAHGGRFIFAGEVKSYSRWIGVPGQRGGILNEVSLSERIQEQIARDVWLRDNVPGYYPNWTFTDAPPSQALRQALRDAGITIVEHVR